VSSWLDEQEKPAALPEGAWRLRIAMKDIAEVSSADAILMDISEDSTTGGRYVEWGVASNPHAYILRVLIGRRPAGDFFGHLADRHFPDWDTCLASALFTAENESCPAAGRPLTIEEYANMVHNVKLKA
jgi:hypothetical protein